MPAPATFPSRRNGHGMEKTMAVLWEVVGFFSDFFYEKIFFLFLCTLTGTVGGNLDFADLHFLDSAHPSSKSVRPLTTSTARCGFLGLVWTSRQREKELWKIIIFHGKIHYKWWFSIVMLVYQRVDGSTYFDLIFSRFYIFQYTWTRLGSINYAILY